MMTFLMILGIINTIIVTAEVVILLLAIYTLKSEGYSVKEFFKAAFSFGANYEEDLPEEEPQLTIGLNKYPWGEEPLINEETKRHNEELDAEVDALLGRNQ